MDTTIALFFSLGIVMSPNHESTTAIHIDKAKAKANTVITQQQVVPTNHKALLRHELTKKRIAATNAWLAKQRQQRRSLAKKHQTIRIARASNTQSCDANWKIT